MQWSEILSEIKRTLKEPSIDGHWSDIEYLRRANIIQRQICKETECINQNYSDLAITGLAGYDKPTNLIKLNSVIYNNVKLYEIDSTSLDIGVIQNIISEDWRTLSGVPNSFYQTQDKIFLYPAPDTNDVIINMNYITYADDIINTYDIPFNSLTNLLIYNDLIILGVVYKCLMEDQKPFYQDFKVEFNEGLSKMKNNMKKKTNVLQSFSLLNKNSRKNISPFNF